MTAIQLRAELFRELNIIMSDENLMEKAIKSLRRINKKRAQQTDSTVVDVSALAADEKLAYILSK